jgi:hypothetical protein
LKKLLVISCLALIGAVLISPLTLFAGVDDVPIRDIQYTEDASGDSPLKDQSVTISGIVTAEPYAFGGGYYFVQDANEAWSGIKVYDPDRQVAQGDLVTLTGTVQERYGNTQLSNITTFEIVAPDSGGIDPLVVTTGEIATNGSMAEAYEGCLVRVENVNITNPDLGYGEWEVDDGSGACRVDDAADYYFNPAEYTGAASITGVLEYSFNDTKIEPRLAYDIIENDGITRIQRVQQVRYSDLMKAAEDNVSDISYLQGDTLTVQGVVTMPTGLSYAGAGIKFIFTEPEGGPWSAILSYNADSTAYPTLYEGDLIEMTGYIDEYTTGPSNMTEFFITSPINILSVGNELPEPDSVATGDLRWPTEAEQWGNVMVKVGNAQVVNVNPQYELFAVDDGTGSVLVDDDSDSLENFPDPPLGTIAEMIRGWVYHHYGSYADSTAYKLEPLYKSDIVWGAGPPSLQNTSRTEAYVASNVPMIVTTVVETNLNIAGVKIYYKVDDGEYQEVAMTDLGDNLYSGEIPGQPDGSFVSYFVQAVDDQGQMSTDPPDVTEENLSYVVSDDDIAIADIQYSPFEIADSPFEGHPVEVTGIVTVDTSFFNKYEAYAIQDKAGAWNGIFAFGALPAMFKGDMVTVYGTVTDYNPDWGFKWDNNTVILADSVKIHSSGNPVPDVVTVSTGDLTSKTDMAESYEGTLVRVEGATLTSINRYDVTVDDGTGECLLDADAFVGADQDPNPHFYIDRDNELLIINSNDTLRVGDQIDFAQGVFLFSFGTHKIEIRNMADFGTATGVRDAVKAQPLTYGLEQNYPNPFNPETRIYFSLPDYQHVSLVVYNSLGQQVRSLVNTPYAPGRHVVNWDGRNQAGQMMPSGVYFYRIKAGNFIAHKKMLLVK